ncbi:major latex protein 15-like [Papaver somniferum]|uniref:major latex protein 15-like n=1 Tax=Papaver somniferum TaxID=3469 RepID=UPI000E7060E3|nr:major latex protein 15-like [Papaver somniferum]
MSLPIYLGNNKYQLPKMTQHHSISGLVGKLVAESEVNCSADKYYEMFKQHEGIPPAIPHIYTGVNVIEGHGTTSGCIIQWNYIVESKNEFVHTKITYDDETRTIRYDVLEGQAMEKYKNFSAILIAKPKDNGHGSIVSWTIEYENINEDSPVPFHYLGFFQSIIKDLDSYICGLQ